MATKPRGLRSHLSHWGAFDAEVQDDGNVKLHPFVHDPNPSPLLDNIPSSLRHETRISAPAVRKGWLENGPGPSDKRGSEPFVEVSWDQLTELLSADIARVYREHGPSAVYGGSYGWASAGRFHHAQSQLHRFLNQLGGYTYGVGAYSHGAGTVILPHVLTDAVTIMSSGTNWQNLAEHTDIFLSFGGMPLKNTNVTSGGIFRHRTKDWMEAAHQRGAKYIAVSPIRDDLHPELDARWIPIAPGTDVPFMLGIAHTLITENLHDRDFVARYTVGYGQMERYILGGEDGVVKDADWAADLSEIPAEDIRALARELSGKRVLVSTTWSLQRTEFGEQPPWMAITLAALLGQIGLPGGGYGFGYGSTQRVGEGLAMGGAKLPTFSQGRNPCTSFIPFARIADMLHNPGAEFDYNGGRYSYPEIKLVYWAGGNLFHHHQHLGRLRRGLAKVDTIVVHDPFWTATARQADIVVPSTVSLERNDIGGSTNDAYLAAMQAAVPPHANARNDFDAFGDLADALGVWDSFTEGRDEMGWLRHLYETWREDVAKLGHDFPEFDTFWSEGYIELPIQEEYVMLSDFRNDPDGSPLKTPSGRVELYSETIAGFGYDTCPGHPTWFPRNEWLGNPRAEEFPLLMIANNPSTRLHSQLDVGKYSQDSKRQGREPLRMRADDAAARGISDGDVVRIFNDRGSLLAGVVISDALRPSVIQISTGAWYDPDDPSDFDAMCVHGNPNTVTRDIATSQLAQACCGQHALVQVERWEGPLPEISVTSAPEIVPLTE